MNNEYYFDKQNWEINQEGRGVQINPLLALLLASTVGAAFVVFMPFIGIALVVQHFMVKAVDASKNFVRTLLSPAAVPGNSYFVGHETASNNQSDDNSLEEIEKEIQERREQN